MSEPTNTSAGPSGAKSDPLQAVHRVRNITIILGLFVTLAAGVISGNLLIAGSTALGAALISANLFAIEWIVERYFRPDADRSSAGGFLLLKLASMVLILYAVVRYVPVHLPAFIGGFSVFVLASIWEGISAPKTPAAGPEVKEP